MTGLFGWVPCFSRSFNDYELEEVDHFLLKIQAKKAYKEEHTVI